MTIQEKMELLWQGMVNFGYIYSPLFMDEHECIFKPGITTKAYDKNDDLFYLNAKYQNGKNIYEEYQKKYYYNYFPKKLIEKRSVLLSPYIINSRVKGNLLFRFINLPACVYLANNYISKNFAEINVSEKSILDSVEDNINEEIPKLEDAIKKGIDSKYYAEEVNKMTNVVKVNSDNLKKINISTLLTIRSLLAKRLENIEIDLELVKSIKKVPIFISIEEFLDCFDLDKLFVLYGKIIMSKINSFDKENPDELYPLFPQVYNYIHFVEELGLNDYNPRITYNEKIKNKVKKQYYYFKDLKSQVNSYLKKNPNITFKYVSIFDPVLDKDHMNKSMEELSKEAVKYRFGEDNQILAQEWEFIRKGEIEVDRNNNHKNSRNITHLDSVNSSSSQDRENLFMQTDYVCKIVGSNKFIGYVGYIYKNGVVAFERFYDEDGNLSKSNNATYIMNIDNFREFTKLSKPEIIEYIKKTENPDIKRKYHNKNWSNNIKKIVENDYYSEETMEKVDNLLKQIKQLKNKR